MDDFDFDPTAADLAEVDESVEDLTAADWEALLPKAVESESFDWDDEPVLDDRWSGDGVPSWSAWA